MAKNNAPKDAYTRQQEAIRKAKGNPNKNVHHKKNNSNYGGGDYLKEKAAQKAAKPDKPKLPKWLKITPGRTVRRTDGSADPAHDGVQGQLVYELPDLAAPGLACAALFYTRRFRNTQKEGALYTIVSVILAIMAVIYGGMGLLGILRYLGAF